MFKPRIPKAGKVDKDELVNKFSTLKAEITALKNCKNIKKTFSFNEVVEILKKENASLSKLLDYEEERQTKLKEEKSILSGDKEEEESMIACCSDCIKNESFLRAEAIDTAQEMLMKLTSLHENLCSLLKKFAQDISPVPEKKSGVRATRSRSVSDCRKRKNNILHILQLLLPELNSTENDNLEPQILKIDKTVSNEAIQFLLSADIIEHCPDNPNCIRLLNAFSL